MSSAREVQEQPEAGEAAATWEDVSSLSPWSRNPKKIKKADVEEVAASIKRFGFGAPLIARDADGRIIGGHTRIEAAKLVGMKRIPVRRMVVTEDEADALALADNQLARIAQFDNKAIGEILADLKSKQFALDGLGFKAADLHRLIRGAGGPVDDDVPPPVPKEAVTHTGDIIDLGPHRLICGDSTDPAVLDALLADDVGETPVDLVWTDPPYGVAVIGGDRTMNNGDRLAAGGKTIENDSLDEVKLEAMLRAAFGNAVIHTKPGGVWYVAAPPVPAVHVFGTVLKEHKIWRQSIVWLKDSHVMGRSDYHYRHEHIFYGWLPGAGHFFVDDRSQNNVWEIPRPKASPDHPTMKPVELVARAIRNSSKPGEIVLDPFGGSGTSCIAAHHEERRARLVEKSPNYCDVIIKRYEAISGIKAVRRPRR